MKEKLREAFYAGRERITHPDFDFVYDDFDDWYENEIKTRRTQKQIINGNKNKQSS